MIRRLVSRLPVQGLLLQNRFAEAMARLPETAADDAYAWAWYRLGCYRRVAEVLAPGGGRRGWKRQFSVAVSLAACHQAEQAAAVVRALLAEGSLPTRQRLPLASALAPFLPALALEVLGTAPAPPDARAAIEEAAGHPEAASATVRHALRRGDGTQWPELHLLDANLHLPPGGAAAEQPARVLDCLNRYLHGYDLPPVALLDTALPPSACNLRGAAPVKPFDGPLITVLVAAFNAEDRLGFALQGLCAQSYANLEIIVLDDASTDGTADAVAAFGRQDPRVRYVRLPVNVGPYVAKNVGLRMARGEFVTCHDSDDWSHPLKLEKQARPLLEDPRLVASASSWVRLTDDGVFYARPVTPLARMNPSSPLYRRQAVLDRAGAYDPVRTGADSEFFARLKLVFGRRAVRRVGLPLAFGAHRPGSLMTDATTGMPQGSMSPERLSYWEAWTDWHVSSLRAGRKPRLDDGGERLFGAPPRLIVPADDRSRCFSLVGEAGISEPAAL